MCLCVCKLPIYLCNGNKTALEHSGQETITWQVAIVLNANRTKRAEKKNTLLIGVTHPIK